MTEELVPLRQIKLEDMKITPSAGQRISLADADYIANDGCWIEIRGFAVRLIAGDDGISINVYQSGRELEPSIAETWATYSMLETDDDKEE